MVVTLAPSHDTASAVHDLIALPLTCTTQAPHWLVSQPTCVPVSRKFSRRKCTSRRRGSTSAVTALPFTVMVTTLIILLPCLYLVRVSGSPSAQCLSPLRTY